MEVITLESRNIQRIGFGNGNIQANGDVTIQYFKNDQPLVLRFYENDICMVIEQFNNYITELDDNVEITDQSTLEYVEKPEKNRINNLSEEYFQSICENYLPYFRKIDEFLKAPQNKKYLKKYKATAKELKFKIDVERKNYQYFEEILNAILLNVLNGNNPSIIENRDVFIVFLNYMYWNCDIGRRKEYVSPR